jgi:Flp pilus assembly protein CpaB
VAAKAAGRTPVLVTARAVPAGQVLTSADVRSVDLAGAEVLGAFAVSERERVVGRVAALPLAAGVLLTPGVVGASGWPPAGQAVISVVVKPGAGPVVQPGARVGLVVVADTGAGAAPGAGSPPGRPVVGVVAASEDAGAAAGSGSRLVSVVVAATDAPGLAAAAAGGRVALVWLAAG